MHNGARRRWDRGRVGGKFQACPGVRCSTIPAHITRTSKGVFVLKNLAEVKDTEVRRSRWTLVLPIYT
jgi:hypothetical protein